MAGAAAGIKTIPAWDHRARRNFRLCVANGAVVVGGMAFFAWPTVMAGLAFELTGSDVLVGVLTSLAPFGWQWPQLVVGNLIEHRPRKMPVYVISALVRTVSLGVMIAAVLLLSHKPLVLYWAIIACIAVMTSAGGVCVIPFMDIVAKSIPPDRRGLLFAYRNFLGGILGSAAGVVTVYVLSRESRLEYPYNYAVLLLAGFGLCTLAYSFFMRTDEPDAPVPPHRVSFLSFIGRGFRICTRDRDFMLFMGYRVCFHLAIMAQALLVPFAMKTYNAPIENTGWFAAAMALAMGTSSLFWGAISRRFSEVQLFRWGTVLLTISVLAALGAASAPEGSPWHAWLENHSLAALLFMYACHTVGVNGIGIAATVYTLGLPPDEQRPLYVSFGNTLIAPLNATPILAGVLAAAFSYQVAFAAAAAASCAGFLFTLALRRQS